MLTVTRVEGLRLQKAKFTALLWHKRMGASNSRDCASKSTSVYGCRGPIGAHTALLQLHQPLQVLVQIVTELKLGVFAAAWAHPASAASRVRQLAAAATASPIVVAIATPAVVAVRVTARIALHLSQQQRQHARAACCNTHAWQSAAQQRVQQIGVQRSELSAPTRRPVARRKVGRRRGLVVAAHVELGRAVAAERRCERHLSRAVQLAEQPQRRQLLWQRDRWGSRQQSRQRAAAAAIERPRT
eukprot:365857-Chlamydomonas_euryale.AAC.2